jgi:hypothetical protein
MGCGKAATADENSGAATVPTAVQKFVDVEFPLDGEVHVQTRGRFKIEPETLFCGHSSSTDKEMRDFGVTGVGLVEIPSLLRSIGQSADLNGTIRQREIGQRGCEKISTNIQFKGYAYLNRNRRPYKLIQAVWQGDAIWVGSIGKDLDPSKKEDWGSFPPQVGGVTVRNVSGPSIDKISESYISFIIKDNSK